MTRPAGLILAVWCALALTIGTRPAGATDTKPTPAPKVAAPKPVAPMAAPKPPMAAPKPALAGAAPGPYARPGVPAPAAHPGAPVPGHPALAGKPATLPGAPHREAALPGPHPAGAHGPDVHPAAFRPRELPPDDPARAHGRFDEHVHDADREREIVRLHEHDFHVGDVRHFHDAELNEWRGGHWHRDLYDGRYGWWYDVDGVWYPYAAPVYPYPVVVAPLIAEEEAAPVAALPVAEADDAPVMAIAPLPPPPHVAYHCSSPAGFYPVLATCDTEWVTLAPH